MRSRQRSTGKIFREQVSTLACTTTEDIDNQTQHNTPTQNTQLNPISPIKTNNINIIEKQNSIDLTPFPESPNNLNDFDYPLTGNNIVTSPENSNTSHTSIEQNQNQT